MARNDLIRSEFADWLRGYLEQRAAISDVLDFEAQYALDDEVDADLRRLLWRVALVGDEVVSKWRPASEFDDLARETLGKLTPQAAATEAAAD